MGPSLYGMIRGFERPLTFPAVELSKKVPREASAYFFSSVVRWRGRCSRHRRSWRLARLHGLVAAHSFLEFTNPLAKTLHHLGNLASAKQDKNHHRNNQQMHGAIPHRAPTFQDSCRRGSESPLAPTHSIARTSGMRDGRHPSAAQALCWASKPAPGSNADCLFCRLFAIWTR